MSLRKVSATSFKMYTLLKSSINIFLHVQCVISFIFFSIKLVSQHCCIASWITLLARITTGVSEQNTVSVASWSDVQRLWLAVAKRDSLSSLLGTFAKHYGNKNVTKQNNGCARALDVRAKIFHSRDIFQDNELLVPEMQNIGGHRLRFRYKACQI